jgi:hypothetical protein
MRLKNHQRWRGFNVVSLWVATLGLVEKQRLEN